MIWICEISWLFVAYFQGINCEILGLTVLCVITYCARKKETYYL